MFSHVMLGYNDIDAARTFYDATLGALDVKPARQDDRERLIYFHNGGLLMLSRPIDGAPACPANGGTVGFAASSPEQVDAWHKAGVANGGSPIEDDPGVREASFGKLYLAYLRDPAGNKLCAMHRMAA